ncbi:hypothetical protein LMG1864_03012 [Achromobacter ruhlandii]|nr:hypothetical protein LMG1864_03012 [Achromobacter ruhlandii]
MTRDEYFAALNVFQKLCEQQPNLFNGIAAGSITGKNLATTVTAFITEHVRLQQELLKG